MNKYVYIKCNNCNTNFKKRIKSEKIKTVKCLKCKLNIEIENNLLQGKDKENYLKNEHKRRIERNSKIKSENIPLGIKSNQIPTSIYEAKFKKLSIDKGFKVHRPSWPDFILEKDGKYFFVEVKSNADTISEEQLQTFNLLEQIGLNVYIWKNNKHFKDRLIKWAKGAAKYLTENI